MKKAKTFSAKPGVCGAFGCGKAIPNDGRRKTCGAAECIRLFRVDFLRRRAKPTKLRRVVSVRELKRGGYKPWVSIRLDCGHSVAAPPSIAERPQKRRRCPLGCTAPK